VLFLQEDEKGREYSMHGRDEKCRQNCIRDNLKGKDQGVNGRIILKRVQKEDMRMWTSGGLL
jgi:hypothetical protein